MIIFGDMKRDCYTLTVPEMTVYRHALLEESYEFHIITYTANDQLHESNVVGAILCHTRTLLCPDHMSSRVIWFVEELAFRLLVISITFQS